MSNAEAYPLLLFQCLSGIGTFVNILIIGLGIIDRRAQTVNNNLLFINLLSSYAIFNTLAFTGLLVQVDLIDYSALAITVSILALCILTVDRVITIRLPYRYKSQHTCLICLQVAMCWTIPASYYGLQMSLVGHDLQYRAAMLIFVPIAGSILLLVANSLIFVVAHRQLKDILRTTAHLSNQYRPNIQNLDFKENMPIYGSETHFKLFCDTERKVKDAAKLKREVHMVYSCFEMVILFSVTWLPLSLYLLITMESHHGKMTGYSFLLRVPVFLNSIVTPFVYILRNRSLKRAISNRWCCQNKRGRTQVV